MATVSQTYAKVDDLEEVRTGLVGRKTIYDLIRKKKIPVVRLSSHNFLVPRDWMRYVTENLPTESEDA
jgi:hypothetical protein